MAIYPLNVDPEPCLGLPSPCGAMTGPALGHIRATPAVLTLPELGPA